MQDIFGYAVSVSAGVIGGVAVFLAILNFSTLAEAMIYGKHVLRRDASMLFWRGFTSLWLTFITGVLFLSLGQ